MSHHWIWCLALHCSVNSGRTCSHVMTWTLSLCLVLAAISSCVLQEQGLQSRQLHACLLLSSVCACVVCESHAHLPSTLPMYSLLLSTSVQLSGTHSACSWPSCRHTTRQGSIHQEKRRLLNKLEGLPHWWLSQREPHSSHAKVCPHSIPHALHDTMLKLAECNSWTKLFVYATNYIQFIVISWWSSSGPKRLE